MPLAVGAVAEGGDTFTIQVSFGSFAGPVDIYFAYAASTDPDMLYLMKSDYTIQQFSLSQVSDALYNGGALPAGFEAWKKSIAGPVNEILFKDIPVSALPAGEYDVYIMVTQAGNLSNYYLWGTSFTSTGQATPPASLDAQPPVGQSEYTYDPPAFPSVKSDPAGAMPIAVGPAALGGDTVSVQVGLGKLLSPVDVYVAYGAAADPDKVYVMKSDYTVQAFSLTEISNAIYSGGSMPAGFEPWKKNTTGPIDEILLNGIPVSQIPSGDYALYIMTTPAGNMTSHSLWGTTFSGSGSDGATLYGQNCAGCHGPLASSAKTGRTAAQIRAAVAANTGGMGYMSGLSEFQLQLISGALSQPTPPPMPLSVQTTDGATLYARSCAICHGNSRSAFPAGATSTQVQTAINSVPEMKGLGYLMPGQLTAISSKMMGGLPAAPTTTDGATLYAQNCSSCHGALASSTKAGRTAAQISGAIANANYPMGSLSSLTSVQVQAIAGVLAVQTPPSPPPPPTTTDGATLYTQNCSSCHGALASSTKAGRTAAQISAAIANANYPMGSLSSLTSAQVQAIAGVLAGQTPPPPPPPPTTTDGATLYTQNCASCHGALASSTKAGRTAAQISAAIANPNYPMGSLSSLTSVQVAAIASVLATQTPSPAPAPSGHPSNWRSAHGDYVEKNGTVSCTSCHGADLRGGSGPSCYSCHGKRW
jgi:mono/diheme cytochrome c family protein